MRVPNGIVAVILVAGFCAPARASTAPGVADGSCPPSGTTRAELIALRATAFEIADEDRRNDLAVQLLACVGDPDPALRDGIVYSGFAHWLRSGRLSEATRRILYGRLLALLNDPDDPEGFVRPFAALDLAEVVRTDRLQPWLTPGMRKRLVDAAARYLAGVSDYRGFSEAEGWRHGVAHGADLVLQLVLNPLVDADAQTRLLDAVAKQVAPDGAVFYVYGEPERLARPVMFAWRRGDLDPAFWTDWFARIVGPAPLKSWQDAFGSNAGLARRHNTLSFLAMLHLDATAGAQPDARLAELVEHAIRTVGGD